MISNSFSTPLDIWKEEMFFLSLPRFFSKKGWLYFQLNWFRQNWINLTIYNYLKKIKSILCKFSLTRFEKYQNENSDLKHLIAFQVPPGGPWPHNLPHRNTWCAFRPPHVTQQPTQPWRPRLPCPTMVHFWVRSPEATKLPLNHQNPLPHLLHRRVVLPRLTPWSCPQTRRLSSIPLRLLDPGIRVTRTVGERRRSRWINRQIRYTFAISRWTSIIISPFVFFRTKIMPFWNWLNVSTLGLYFVSS